jgi:hypothetical protein
VPIRGATCKGWGGASGFDEVKCIYLTNVKLKIHMRQLKVHDLIKNLPMGSFRKSKHGYGRVSGKT